MGGIQGPELFEADKLPMTKANTLSTARLRGVIAAIPTPLGDAGPDYAGLIRLARHLLDSGCHGLNLLGTTGEATSFSVQERMSIMSEVSRAGLPMDRIMVGTGAAAVADAVALSKHASALGFAGLLLLPPFYYKGVSRSGITEYVRRVVASIADSRMPVYLYNFPALSGVSYTPELVAELLGLFGERIAGLKDSSGDMVYANAIATVSDSLDVFPSNEEHLLLAREGGLAGCISATANINAGDCAKAFNSGDRVALARAVAVRKLFNDLPLVPAVKYVLSRMHRDQRLARVMPPLIELSADHVSELHRRFDQQGWSVEDIR